ncbi:unnamed protein product, partial [Allacma fusca]
MPFMIFGAGVATILLVLFLPERSFSVHCLIPVTYQSSMTYFACSVVDVAFLVNTTSTGSVGMFIILAFFLKIDGSLDALIPGQNSERYSNWRETFLNSSIDSCKKIQLELQLYNHKFMNMNYFIKLFDMVMPTICFYFAIVYYDQHPKFALNFLMIGLDVMMGFVL